MRLLEGSYSNDTHWVATIACTGCSEWDLGSQAGSLDPAGENQLAFAFSVDFESPDLVWMCGRGGRTGGTIFDRMGGGRSALDCLGLRRWGCMAWNRGMMYLLVWAGCDSYRHDGMRVDELAKRRERSEEGLTI